jgi:hypothetical protein
LSSRFGGSKAPAAQRRPKALKMDGFLAHPTRFERVTFAFGGQLGRRFRKVIVIEVNHLLVA